MTKNQDRKKTSYFGCQVDQPQPDDKSSPSMDFCIKDAIVAKYEKNDSL
jgi:hypothetical protein